MNTYQDKNTQMQSKLSEGLQTLVEASETDRRLLGVALIQIHGAMEDFVRMELARQAPELRTEVEDVKQSSWRELVSYSKRRLSFGEADADMILSANTQRNDFAHGGKFDWRRRDIVRYAQYVHRKCRPNQPVPDLGYRTPAPTAEAAEPAKPGKLIEPARPPKPTISWSRLLGFVLLIFCLCGLAAALYNAPGHKLRFP